MIEKIQSLLKQETVGGWLFYNFRNLDPIANNILQIPNHVMATRRWFYFIPTEGQPLKLVHKIEAHILDHLPGEKRLYAGWKSLHQELQSILAGQSKVCMQYSPMNEIPYVAFVDAGTIELVRSLGVEVCSSANLIQIFASAWNESQRLSHLRAADIVYNTVQAAFQKVKEAVAQNQPINEYQVQQFILEKFAEVDLDPDHAPIVAVNEHSGDPHYETSEKNPAQIREGDFLLIDLWGKETNEKAVFADITWVAYVGKQVPEEYTKVFNIVRDARDNAVTLIEQRLQQGQEVYGYEVDDACREVIEKAGYGEYFVHRTGHSIDDNLHGKGVNIDNLETKDNRKLVEGSGFSVEPGIYMKNFGIRSEINAYIHEGQVHVSGHRQQEVIALL